MGEVSEVMYLVWTVLASSVQGLGYVGIGLFVYIVMIELHERHTRRRIKNEARAERRLNGLRIHP